MERGKKSLEAGFIWELTMAPCMESITRKSLLYKTRVEYGDYTINHIEGCAHGCRYPCYAMLMSRRFGRIKTYSDWLRPKIVSNWRNLLEAEIPRMRKKIKSVHLCFMSDPFMLGFPPVISTSLDIIQMLNEKGIKVTTLTKGLYPDYLLDYGINPNNEYGISLVSTDSSFYERFEPFAAKWFLRIRGLERLKKDGAFTWVSVEPYPTPDLIRQNIFNLLNRISFADRIIFGKLNYNAQSTTSTKHQEYYNELCLTVKEFCERRNIEIIIKRGTFTGRVMHLREVSTCPVKPAYVPAD